MNDEVPISASSQHTTGSEFVANDQSERINRILAEYNLSPSRSQVTTSIKNQSTVLFAVCYLNLHEDRKLFKVSLNLTKGNASY